MRVLHLIIGVVGKSVFRTVPLPQRLYLKEKSVQQNRIVYSKYSLRPASCNNTRYLFKNK